MKVLWFVFCLVASVVELGMAIKAMNKGSEVAMWVCCFFTVVWVANLVVATIKLDRD